MDFNDLGYLRNADWYEAGALLRYYNPEQAGWLRSRDIRLRIGDNHDFSGMRTSSSAMLQSEFRSTGNHYLWSRLTYTDNIRDPRMLWGGPSLRMPAKLASWVYYESDDSRPWQLSFDGGINWGEEKHFGYHSLEPGLILRPDPRFKISLGFRYEHVRRPTQYVATLQRASGEKTWIAAHLDQQTIAPWLRLEMNFSPTMALTYYGGPFSSTGRYSRFKAVTAPHAAHYADRFTMLETTVNGSDRSAKLGTDPLRFANPDFDWRELKSNLVFRWEYRPGSNLYCVWSQNRNNWDDVGDFSPLPQLRQLFTTPPSNSFLIKLSYWFTL